LFFQFIYTNVALNKYVIFLHSLLPLRCTWSSGPQACLFPPRRRFFGWSSNHLCTAYRTSLSVENRRPRKAFFERSKEMVVGRGRNLGCRQGVPAPRNPNG